MRNKFEDYKRHKDIMRQIDGNPPSGNTEMADWQDYYDEAMFTGRGYDTMPVGAKNFPKGKESE